VKTNKQSTNWWCKKEHRKKRDSLYIKLHITDIYNLTGNKKQKNKRFNCMASNNFKYFIIVIFGYSYAQTKHIATKLYMLAIQ